MLQCKVPKKLMKPTICWTCQWNEWFTSRNQGSSLIKRFASVCRKTQTHNLVFQLDEFLIAIKTVFYTSSIYQMFGYSPTHQKTLPISLQYRGYRSCQRIQIEILHIKRYSFSIDFNLRRVFLANNLAKSILLVAFIVYHAFQLIILYTVTVPLLINSHMPWILSFRISKLQNFIEKSKKVELLNTMDVFVSGSRVLYFQVDEELHWISWHFTNKHMRGELSIKNWLPLATGSNMEDEMILILLLLKKRLQNLIFLMNYLIFSRAALCCLNLK